MAATVRTRQITTPHHGAPAIAVHDPDLGRPVRYLFLRNGGLPGPDCLFANPLREICQAFGVATPQYAPRLRERLCTERQLITDASDRSWEREIECHQRIADRITSLLDDLGEPHDEPAE